MCRVNDVDPCFDCQKRHALCWNSCPDYAAMRKRLDTIRQNRTKEQNVWVPIWNRKRGHKVSVY